MAVSSLKMVSSKISTTVAWLRPRPALNAGIMFLVWILSGLWAPMLAAAQVRSEKKTGGTVEGIVKDQIGDIVVGAQATLKNNQGLDLAITANERGEFKFSGLGPGIYTLAVTYQGFAPDESTVEIGADKALVRKIVVLKPTVAETLVIEERDKVVALDPDKAVGSQILKKEDLEALPDDPDQFHEQLQLLATSSGSAPGQATVTVDGFTEEGRIPPKSAIREVRINPDLFSAEYDKAPYRGGRIEIITQPGAISYNGSAFFAHNDSALNARDAFAATKPHTNTSRYGFEFGGPIVKNKIGFLLDFEGRDINESVPVSAVVLDASFNPTPFSANISDPKRLLIGSARVDWQVNPKSSLTFRYDINDDTLKNQGVGGFALADRAYNTDIRENTFRISETTALSPKTLNEVRAGITFFRTTSQAATTSPALDVLGFFSSGGNSLQLQQQDGTRVEIADNLSYILKKHRIKSGVQVFGRNIHDSNRSNFNGEFLFGGGVAEELDSKGNPVPGTMINITGLEQYRRALLGLPGGTASKYIITKGIPYAKTNQWNGALFTQDEWSIRKNALLSLGLRYEAQSNPTDRGSIAPRLGFAYSPDSKSAWVLRARVGMFYDRIPFTVPLDAAHLNGSNQLQILVPSAPYPDPLAGGVVDTLSPTIREISRDIESPVSFQWQVGFEHQLPHGWKVEMSQSFSRSWHSLLSRNINAPIVTDGVDPTTAPRPFGTNNNIFAFESSGRVKGEVLYVGVSQTKSRRLNLYSGYLYFNFHNTTDSSTTQPQYSYNVDAEWSRPTWMARHRMFAVLLLNMPWKLRASTNLSIASGTPFNITTGIDNNGDGVFTDRPDLVSSSFAGAIVTRFGTFNPNVVNGDLSRNFGTNPARVNLDLDLSRTFALTKSQSSAAGPGSRGTDREYRLTVDVRATNILNYTNVVGLSGVLNSPFFGRANIALPARHIETGLRFSF